MQFFMRSAPQHLGVWGYLFTPLLLMACSEASSNAQQSAAPSGPYAYLSARALDDAVFQAGTARDIRPTGKVVEIRLEAAKGPWELAPGILTEAMTYNGAVPGPTIRATEGDTLRVTLANKLQQDTSIHWHGLHMKNDMDGVPPHTQAPIRPGETFVYEFIVSHAGTFMYHPHVNSVEQIDSGLYGALIVDPQQPDAPKADKEFTMMLGAWNISGGMMSAGPGMPDGMGGTNPGAPGMPGMGGTSPGAPGMPGMGGTSPGAPGMPGMGGTNPGAPGMPGMGGASAGAPGMPGMGGMTPGGSGVPGGMMPSGMGMMMGYNWFTISGKAFPANAEWAVKEGELVRVRLLNISNLSHPMHLHGHDFKVISKDGEPLPALQQTVMNTITVNPGETYDILVLANNPGLWMFHCHELHHTENDGVEPGGLIQVLQYEGFAQPPASTGTPPPGPARQQPGIPGMRH